jgi:hypothetical protein
MSGGLQWKLARPGASNEPKRLAQVFVLTGRTLMFLEIASAGFVFEAAIAAADFPRRVFNSARIRPRDQDLAARILIAFDEE